MAALQLIDAHPDTTQLLTSIVTPGINGRKLPDETLRRRPDLEVLYTFGCTPNAVVHYGVIDPGTELIGKPFTIEQLANKVRRVLESWLRYPGCGKVFTGSACCDDKLAQ